MTDGPTTDGSATFGLGPIDQVAFVVEDLDAALPVYTALFGPFEVRAPQRAERTARGRVVAPTLRVAIAHCGSLEIELIQPVDGESPHRDFLEHHGDGYHHVRFRVEDFDAKRDSLEAAGYTSVFEGNSTRSRYVYLESPERLGHTQLELIRPHDAHRG